MRREDWDARYAEGPLVWGSKPNRFVERELADLPPGRALDLASGEGRNAIWLAARGWDVVALDYSAVATARASELAAAAGVEIDAREADVLSADVGGPYDLVLIAYLQLPAAERVRLVSIAADVLEVDGTFLLVAHDARNLAEGHGGPKDPGVLWTPDEVVERLGGGFTIERAGVEERVVEGAPRPALDTIVRARRRA